MPGVDQDHGARQAGQHIIEVSTRPRFKPLYRRVLQSRTELPGPVAQGSCKIRGTCIKDRVLSTGAGEHEGMVSYLLQTDREIDCISDEAVVRGLSGIVPALT